MDIEISANKDDICTGIRCAIFVQKTQLLSGESIEQEADLTLCQPDGLASRVDLIENQYCVNCKLTKLMR